MGAAADKESCNGSEIAEAGRARKDQETLGGCVSGGHRCIFGLLLFYQNSEVKLKVMGHEYGYNDSIIEVNNGAEIKILLPPEITTEMCRPYITSLNNLKGQVINCIKQISRKSNTVNDKVCGLETDGANLEVFTSGIEYKDIDVRIQ